MPKPIVYFIVGATASGKTAAAVYIAKRLNGEIVSADAIQIYKGLDRGAAKPTLEEMEGVPHHLIDIVEYSYGAYNVACFCADAAKCISGILSRGKVPIVAGGTGLYVNSLLYPLSFTAVKPDESLRSELEKMELMEPGTLYKELLSIDPATANRLHPNDKKRIIRAIEVYRSSGSGISQLAGDFLNAKNADIPYTPIIAGLTMDRAALYDRINKRVDKMIAEGLEAEARTLYNSCPDRSLPALQAIGYKQFIAYFNGECDYSEAVEAVKRETRRFAKRQIAWFKRDNRIKWFDALSYESSHMLYNAILDYFEEETGNGGRTE